MDSEEFANLELDVMGVVKPNLIDLLFEFFLHEGKVSAKGWRQITVFVAIDRVHESFCKGPTLKFKHIITNLHSSPFNVRIEVVDLGTNMHVHSKASMKSSLRIRTKSHSPWKSYFSPDHNIK
mmetsp:Transcript_18783/g.32308  ORF Transcript_18783/g.32308 Transcript_18783/m.32308 type:complete len:123 (-) Transcript_18783:36-404(-)